MRISKSAAIINIVERSSIAAMFVAIDTDSEILQRLPASRQLFPHPHVQHAIASTTRLTSRLSTFSSLRMQAPTNEVRDAAIIDGAKDIAFGSVSVV